MSGNRLKVATSQLAAEYAAGDSLQKISERHGVTKQAIYYRLKVAGIPRDGTRYPYRFTDPEVQARIRRPTGADHHGFVDLPLNELRTAYEAGESTTAIAHRYGVADMTVLRKLHDAGINIRPRGFPRHKITCADGHIADSYGEFVLDNWLSSHKIAHEIHPPCPWYVWKKVPHKADFRVGNTFIEVWGIDGNKRYNAARAEKLALYAQHGAAVIEVFPHHVTDQNFAHLEGLLK